ncbi:MAG: Panacea domain-containing protein [Gemmatimonadales bacterium]
MAPTLAFREDRATQAAALLLKLNRGRIGFPFMRHIKLIKLMYFADREALLRLGHFITYDRLVSMDNGPVLSRVLDLIKGNIPGPYWTRHISRWLPWWVHLVSDPSTDQLSVAEEKILREVFQRYGHLRWGRIVDVCHELPEWRHPHGSSITIEPREVLIGQNVSAEAADEIVADMVAGASL